MHMVLQCTHQILSPCLVKDETFPDTPPGVAGQNESSLSFVVSGDHNDSDGTALAAVAAGHHEHHVRDPVPNDDVRKMKNCRIET